MCSHNLTRGNTLQEEGKSPNLYESLLMKETGRILSGKEKSKKVFKRYESLSVMKSVSPGV